MTHPRTQIRNAFVEQLTDATAAEERVYKGRLMPINDHDDQPTLPAIVVHTREPEEIQERSPSGWDGFERRRCIVSVICIAQSFDDIDEELDTFAGQVEAVLQSWVIPGFESSDPLLLDTRTDDPDFDGSLTTGAITLRYEVIYRTPYRECSNPYVEADGPLEQSGAYPGGQVTPGCPADNSGAACPIGNATINANGEDLT